MASLVRQFPYFGYCPSVERSIDIDRKCVLRNSMLREVPRYYDFILRVER